LIDDAVGVLGAYGIAAAHLVGVSAGGAFVQLLALDCPDRVLSLVLVSSSPALFDGRHLPPPAEEFGRFASTAQVNWSDADSVTDYVVDYTRLLAGGRRSFDEAAARALVRSDVERARDFTAAQNHEAIADGERSRGPLSSISVPTLVIHGTADPMFPIGHGQALAQQIPGAALLPLDGAGHGVDRADWETIVRAVVEHTAIAEGESPDQSWSRPK
jgi:pimeloyl-ACP methyl ester carboxylesterase